MLLMPHPPRRGSKQPSHRNCLRTHPTPNLLKQSPRHRHSSTRRAQQHVSPRLPPIAAQLQAARPDLEAVQLSCCPDCFSVLKLVDLADHRRGVNHRNPPLNDLPNSCSTCPYLFPRYPCASIDPYHGSCDLHLLTRPHPYTTLRCAFCLIYFVRPQGVTAFDGLTSSFESRMSVV